MSIKEKIKADLKEAMKAKETIRRDTLRLLSGMVKNAEIEKGGEVGDDEVVKIVARSVKQRKESAMQYKEGGRNDLAEKEKQELDILLNYLPQQLSVEEIKKVVDKIIIQTESQSESDMGKVMGAAMKQMAGQADGNLVKEVVEKSLKTIK